MKNTQFLLFCLLTITWISCDKGPDPDFTVEMDRDYCSAPCEVRFTNITEDAEFYEWDFGDGKTADNFSPNNIYAVAGTYSVTLTATDENGNSTSVSKTVVVPGRATKVTVEKITLRQFPFEDVFNNTWDEPGAEEAPDVFIEFTNGSSVVYFTLEDQTVNNVTRVPVEWNTDFEIFDFETEYYIDVMDKDVAPDDNDITGYVIFQPKDYLTGANRYPSNIELKRQDLTRVELDLKWSDE